MREISSVKIQAPVAPSPIPPYSLGIPAPKYPFSPKALKMSHGNSLFHRLSSSLGIISSANFLTSTGNFFFSFCPPRKYFHPGPPLLIFLGFFSESSHIPRFVKKEILTGKVLDEPL